MYVCMYIHITLRVAVIGASCCDCPASFSVNVFESGKES